ncbi:ABC transporter ATP-binding protein [Lacticigenium naphthae]|uniref:ABC transporter ATP-binding protein n=1 Tax=Lacticigenium naphthae TaxID=515351 RepID=UPI00041AEB0E|nr:ABC transporter transmembrane domain-containing protein [Lacticigenium naphthae]
MNIFKQLQWFFKEEKRSYIIGIISLFLVAIIGLIPPRVIGIVVDEIAQDTLTTRSLSLWLILLFASALSQYVLRYIWRVRIWGNAAKLERKIRSRLFNHFMKMDSPFFQKYRTGDLMAHATNDLRGIRMVAGGGILMIADATSVGITTILAMIFVVDWRLTLIAILPLPLLAVISRFLGSALHNRFRDAQAAFSSLNDKVQETIQGIKVLKTFGHEKEDVIEFKEETENVLQKNREVYKIDSLFDPAITLIIGFAYVLTIIVGGNLIRIEEITVGDFVTFINYIGMLIWPMLAVGRLFNIIERGSASYDRINTLLKEESSIIESSNPTETPAVGNITFSIDSFSYPEDDAIALENIHIEIEEGKTLGIVGKTGAGKTTLFKLLMREFDSYKGEIIINQTDIRNFSLDNLLSHIGYVPQDNYLFSLSILDNIRFADPTMSEDKVREIAKLAAVHEDIEDLPMGYETEVGERGVSLSGGQKQRVSIARAMASNPEILILDDSLSAVDAETESNILANLKKQRDNHTTIISAHRISSVMHAEEIIVLKNGKIVERGTHDELLQNNGWYKEMFEQQKLASQKGEELV